MSKFETRIDATGPNGNVFAVIGTARNLMRQIGLPRSEIDAVSARATKAQNYDEALGIIREYFPVDADDSN